MGEVKRVLRLSAVLVMVAIMMPAPRAGAQNNPQVTLTLVAQTPWNSPQHRMFNLKVNAVNNGDTDLGDLSLAVTFFGPLPTRSDYHLSLTEDVGVPIAPTAVVRSETPLSVGSSQVLGYRTDISFLSRYAPEARTFPVTVELLSGTQHVAELRTPLVFLPGEPKEPLNLVWTFVLGHPVTFGPDGVFLSDEVAALVGPGGSISSEVQALNTMLTGPDPSPVDVVVSPTLLEDLARMQDGYDVASAAGARTVDAGEGGAAAAQGTLSALKALSAVQETELSAMPYGVPDLAQLSRSGLEADVPLQIEFAAASVAQHIGTGSDPADGLTP